MIDTRRYEDRVACFHWDPFLSDDQRGLPFVDEKNFFGGTVLMDCDSGTWRHILGRQTNIYRAGCRTDVD
jgi:hypothetical protein